MSVHQLFVVVVCVELWAVAGVTGDDSTTSKYSTTSTAAGLQLPSATEADTSKYSTTSTAAGLQLPSATEADMFEKYGCEHSKGLVQWQCRAGRCYNLSKCDASELTGEYQILFYSHVGLGRMPFLGSDVASLHYRCDYSDSTEQSKPECYLVAVWHFGGNDFLVRGYPGKSYFAQIKSSSAYCTYTNPTTNRLTHTTIPVSVYITGILLNQMIILVLQWKSDASVTNSLLTLLAVWDSLYLACQFAEWVVLQYTDDVYSVIKDAGYVWLDTRCYHYFSNLRGVQGGERCDRRWQWKEADDNVQSTIAYFLQLPHMHFVTMYWFHTAARVFQFMSVYQTIIIACFRFVALRFPFQAHRCLTNKTVLLTTSFCSLMAILLHTPSIAGGIALHQATLCHNKYDYWQDNNYLEDVRHQFYQCWLQSTQHNPFYSSSYENFIAFVEKYHVIFYHIVMFFSLPFLVLLILNVLILRELWKGNQTDENIAVTRVIVSIVSVFLVSYMVKPFYIIDIFFYNASLMDSIAKSSCDGYSTMSVLVVILPALNSSVNFLLYVCLRQSFRDHFLSMFNFCRCHRSSGNPAIEMRTYN